VSIGLDVVLQCLLQTGSSSTTGELKWFNTTQNSEANQNKYGVEMKEDSAQLTFSGVNESHTGSYACRTESTRDMPMEGYEPFNYSKRHKPTNTHGSRKKGLRMGEERREGGLC